ncbi:hypothetical protein ACRAWD_24165 [Caulobacter segnis]
MLRGQNGDWSRAGPDPGHDQPPDRRQPGGRRLAQRSHAGFAGLHPPRNPRQGGHHGPGDPEGRRGRPGLFSLKPHW